MPVNPSAENPITTSAKHAGQLSEQSTTPSHKPVRNQTVLVVLIKLTHTPYESCVIQFSCKRPLVKDADNYDVPFADPHDGSGFTDRETIGSDGSQHRRREGRCCGVEPHTGLHRRADDVEQVQSGGGRAHIGGDARIDMRCGTRRISSGSVNEAVCLDPGDQPARWRLPAGVLVPGSRCGSGSAQDIRAQLIQPFVQARLVRDEAPWNSDHRGHAD